MATKYLYGAAVQGIQQFIFQTNKLREIVGASELVEEICTSKFAQLLGLKGYYPELKEKLRGDNNAILNAAGNIKYIFDETNKKKCEEIVRTFPKEISSLAPGITVSQAVVKYDETDNQSFSQAVELLEKRLRIQRNLPMRSATLGMMGIKRSEQTGLPVVYIENVDNEDVYLDASTFSKLQYQWERKGSTLTARRHTTKNLCNKAFLPWGYKDSEISESEIAHDIEDITGQNDWIAIIHADGNGLGQIVQKVGKDANVFKKFSNDLDRATTEAAYEAYMALREEKKFIVEGHKCIPIRPVVLGGDDLTIICRADIAIDYVRHFMHQFTELTRKYLSDVIIKYNVFTEGSICDALTACAGIAFVKSSYPFYYGYELAETLCTQAKKDAKNKESIKEGRELPMSCLMFHKVQDSFTQEWNDIVSRELTPQKNISFQHGPYYLEDKEDRWTIGTLIDKAEKLRGKEGNAIKSDLRNWISLLHTNPGAAYQKLQRLISKTPEKDYVAEVTKGRNKTIRKNDIDTNVTIYPVYDILAIHTINTQNTKGDER